MSSKSLFKLKIILTLAGGSLAAFLFIFLIATLPLNPANKIYELLGIKKNRVVGFQPYWLLKRADKPYEKYINTFTYFGLTLKSNGAILKLVNPQEEEPGWTTLKSKPLQKRLSQANRKHLGKSLLIHNANEATISALLKEPKQHAHNLITDVKPIMENHGLTNLNLDIESFKEASKSAQIGYTSFVKEIKKGIDENNLGTLTVEITPISLFEPRLTNAEEIGKIADYLVLMAYDFHYIHSFYTGPVSPIGGAPNVREFDVNSSLKKMLSQVPAEKIILGIPLYGYEWETLTNQPGAATIPGGGSTASNRRTTKLLSSCENCTYVFDELASQPYIIFPDEDYFHHIYYENKQSIKEKVKLAEEYKIGGLALWALGYEGDKILEPLKSYKSSFNFDPPLTIIN